MEKWMRALLLCLASTLGSFAAATASDAPGGESKALTAQVLAETKAQAKQTYSEAVQHNDLWTGLQLEAWAASQKVSLRGGPILGASEVYGDPLFACPDDVRNLMDRGDA